MGGSVSAAKAYDGKKGQTCRGLYDRVIVNVYMPGVNGVTDCYPSVLSKASAQKTDFKEDVLIRGHMHTHAQAHSHTHKACPNCTAYTIEWSFCSVVEEMKDTMFLE